MCDLNNGRGAAQLPAVVVKMAEEYEALKAKLDVSEDPREEALGLELLAFQGGVGVQMAAEVIIGSWRTIFG